MPSSTVRNYVPSNTLPGGGSNQISNPQTNPTAASTSQRPGQVSTALIPSVAVASAAVPTAGANPAVRSRQRFDLFAKKCDICLLPTSKSKDITLNKKSLFAKEPRLHETCLVETFPQQADAELRMKSRKESNKIISMDLIRESLTSKPIEAGVTRDRLTYLKLVGRLLETRRHTMPKDRKMQLLMNAGLHLPENTNLEIGQGRRTKRECLLEALELAIELKSTSIIRKLSQTLLSELPQDTQQFLVDGYDRPRALIIQWSKGENLPILSANTVLPTMPRVAAVSIEESMRNGGLGTQNVHKPAVIQEAIERMGRMRARLGNRPLMSIKDVEDSIRQCIAARGQNPSTLAGLVRALEGTYAASKFGSSVSEILAIVWSYIDKTTQGDLRENLINAMLARLKEIHSERPCTVGQILRLTDVPNGVDLSIFQGMISVPQLEAELQQIAAEVSEKFDEEFGQFADVARDQYLSFPNLDDLDQEYDPDAHVSTIKRDQFVNKVISEYVVARELDRDVVMRAADRVFPEGAIL